MPALLTFSHYADGMNRDEEGTHSGGIVPPDVPLVSEQLGEAALKGVFGAFPLIGPALSEAIAFCMRAGTERKTAQFLQYVYRELEGIKELSANLLEEIFADERFEPYLIRAIGMSWETFEEEKLSALAAAALRSASWNKLNTVECEFYWSLLRRYNAVHLKTLSFLHLGQPKGHEPFETIDDFFRHVVGFPAHHDEIGQATMAELYQDKLITDHYGLGYKLSQNAIGGLTTLGGDFLHFVEARAA